MGIPRLAPRPAGARAVKRLTYLELGRRTAFGRPLKKPVGPVPPPPDPAAVADFELATWRVRPSLGRMTKADRILALDPQTLLVLLILAERPAGGVNREQLVVRVFGAGAEQLAHEKLRRCLSFLRRAFSEDGAVRILNAPGDCFVLEVGTPDPGRGLRWPTADVLLDNPTGVESFLKRGKHRALAIGVAAAMVIGLTVLLIAISNDGHVVLLGGRVAGVTALATEPGEKTSPSFSPDGRQLVYSWRQPDGSQKLYLRALTGGAPRALTGGGGGDSFPAWSPRGDLIAFQRRAESSCAVLAIAPGGGEMRLLGDCDFGGGGPMTWLRDGTALIYTHRTAWKLPTQLVSVSVADTRMVGVTNPVVGMPGDSSPALAMTGRRLAFVRTRAPGAADLTLLELGGNLPERLSRDGLATAGAAWEPAGLSLIFSSPRTGRDALWRSRVNGTPPEVLLERPQALRAPALSNDGRALAFERWHETSRLARLPADGSAASAPWRATAARERGAQFAPDGSRLVFVSNQGGRDQLLLAAASGGEAKPLTSGRFDYLEAPRWSADGRFIAFAASRDQQLDVWTVEVASGAERRVTDNGKSRAPSFSHDGRWLYYGSARSAGWQLWRRPWPGDGQPEQLTTEGGLAAIESRDGDSLYFVRPDRRGLWQRPREPGGDDTLISAELSPADFRNWDVTAEAIWFVTRPAEGPPRLGRYSLLDGKFSVRQPLPALLPDAGLTLTPDGQALLIGEATAVQVDLEVAALE